jgi:Ni,Fe-hydrogenase III large subunit
LPGIYDTLSFAAAKEHAGDVASRLRVRIAESKESFSLISQSLKKLSSCSPEIKATGQVKEGIAFGYVEAWRGAVLVWMRLDRDGKIARCKIVDPSFHNWDALSFAVLGNIIPDFPLCNKSFDLSYAGNDL